MKTASKKSVNAKTSPASLSTRRKPKTSQRKTIESTDLNVDDERTNADVSREENYTDDERDQKDSTPVNDSRSIQDTSVEEEQDREVLRKMEDNHPDEALN
jgi:hypothetical protein